MLLLIFACSNTGTMVESKVLTISSGWKMQPSDKLISVDEKTISGNGFSTEEWYDAVVPGTVLGSLATKGVIQDPYFGINMQTVDYEQFKQPWWYRSTFDLNGSDLEKNISLRFNGINYRADLW